MSVCDWSRFCSVSYMSSFWLVSIWPQWAQPQTGICSGIALPLLVPPPPFPLPPAYWLKPQGKLGLTMGLLLNLAKRRIFSFFSFWDDSIA